ncbi:MAG TPA: S9 family peptidase [Anaerolineales bacterium]|nr:S9 family peptidase [Anaerolineales bacterium]
MKPSLAKDIHHRPPSESRPDRRRKAPPPWSLDLLAFENRVRHHRLSPDGRRLAFLWDRDGQSDLWLLPIEGGWPARLTHHRAAETYWSDAPPVWDRSGQRLLLEIDGEIWTVHASTGDLRALTHYGMGAGYPLFSADGARVFFAIEQDERDNLAWIDYDPLPASWPTPVTRLGGDVGEPSLSPDGRHLAFTLSPREDLDRSEIGVVPADGGAVRRLTGSPAVVDHHPLWSPDGTKLAFLSDRSGWHELYLIDAAGGEATPLTKLGADVTEFDWSPDGRRIVLVVNRDGNARLQLIDPAGNDLGVLRDAGGWHSRPQWGPSGDWLTVEFESPTSPPDIFRLDLDGARLAGETRLTESRTPAVTSAGLVTPQVVRYPSSDGTQVTAFLYRPTRASASNRRPAIVYPHGGPADSWGMIWSLRLQWLVAKGYAVLAPDYRGSTGHGKPFQQALYGSWGRVDVEDILASADYLATLEWVDGSRLGIYGSSYGAYLAVLALARDPKYRFRCGAAIYGDSDLRRSWATGDRLGREDLERQMGHPSHNLEAYRFGSPILDVARIERPLLICHGEDDERVHPRQSEELVEELQRQDKAFEYFVYQGEGHGILQPDNLRHFYSRLERFLDWNLI